MKFRGSSDERGFNADGKIYFWSGTSHPFPRMMNRERDCDWMPAGGGNPGWWVLKKKVKPLSDIVLQMKMSKTKREEERREKEKKNLL